MIRPVLLGIQSGQEGWDADLNASLGVLKDGPFPVFQYNGTLAAFAAVYLASSYDRCLAVVNDTTASWVIVISNGSSWEIVGKRAAAVADLTITNPADAPASADALRDDLVTNTLPPIAAKINAIIAALEAAGVMAP